MYLASYILHRHKSLSSMLDGIATVSSLFDLLATPCKCFTVLRSLLEWLAIVSTT